MSKQKKGRLSQSVKNRQTENIVLRFISIFKIPLFCILCTFIVYSSSLQNQFVNWDDGANVGAIKSFDFTAILTNKLAANWAPVNLLLLAIQYQLFGLNPAGYHAVSLLLHLCAVGLTYFVTLKLTDKWLTAGIAALLFGIHPMCVESVAWVSAQNQLLFSLFYLAAMFAWCKYREQHISPGIKNWYLVLTAIFFMLSCLSKGLGVTLPVALVLTDCYRANNWNWKFITARMARMLLFFILSIAVGITAYLVRKNSGSMNNVPNHTPGEQLMCAFYGLIMYIIKFVVPYPLSPFYMYPLRDSTGAYPFIFRISPVLSALFLGIIAGVRFGIKRRALSNVLLFGFLFFMLNIILVLQIKSIGYVMLAERYTYLSYFGLFFITATGFNELWERYRLNNLYRNTLTMGFFLLVITLGFITNAYTSVWKDSITLWTHVIEGFPPVIHLESAQKVYFNRATAYIDQHNFESAIDDYSNAIDLDTNYLEAYLNRGGTYQQMGKLQPALADFNKTIAISPNLPVAYANRGAIFGAQGKYEAALCDFNKAISLNPDFVQAYTNRAILFDLMGNHAGAESDRQKVRELNEKEKEK